MSSWRREMQAFVRAFSGAYLIGIPLLMTMEMWWLGEFAEPLRLLLMMGIALVANLGLAAVVGFKERSRTFVEIVDQAVDAVAVGLVGSAAVLLVLNRISFDEPAPSIVGKIVVQVIPLSVGASIANAIFGRGEGRQGSEGPSSGWRALLNDVAATVIGALIIASAIAPTQEIPMLAASIDYPHLMALIGFSLLVSYGIVFASGFDPASMGEGQQGLFQGPLTETTLAYIVSLVIAAVILFLYQGLGDTVQFTLEQVLVLGLPATIGGAAGRLAI